MAIANRAAFKAYCLRKLGYPVVQINVDDTQVEDRIDDALGYWYEFHGEGLEKVIMIHTITSDDITNQYITIPEPVMSIINVITGATGIPTTNFASGAWQFKYDIFDKLNFGGQSGMVDFVLSMQNLNMIDQIVGNNPRFIYRQHTNKLSIDDDWTNFSVGEKLAYEAYVVVDPTTYADAWNDIWLKDYATALIGEQWGNNLSKFQQVELPGGITLNGSEILDRYERKIEKLREDLELKFVEPPDFLVG